MKTDSKRKILVIEDEATQRRILSVKLKQAGYSVIEAENGQQGLDTCLDDPDIRLVITDLVMPVMDGFKFVRSMREKESRYTYIIAVTASDDKESIVKALTMGADDYLAKPVFQDELNLRLSGAKRLLKLESQDELIMAMVKLAGSRSGETGAHLERVSAYSSIIAHDLVKNHPELGINHIIAEEIANVSPLHDIGKVGIPDNILHKPGKLTFEEFEKMKSHSIVGGNILKETYEKAGSTYLRLAYEIAMHHHEKWNGKGYPDGLAGDKIPLTARIMALADVFDALTAERCYKEAFSYNRAKSIVIEEIGIHFDPMIVDSYLRCEDEWKLVYDDFKED